MDECPPESRFLHCTNARHDSWTPPNPSHIYLRKNDTWMTAPMQESLPSIAPKGLWAISPCTRGGQTPKTRHDLPGKRFISRLCRRSVQIQYKARQWRWSGAKVWTD